MSPVKTPQKHGVQLDPEALLLQLLRLLVDDHQHDPDHLHRRDQERAEGDRAQVVAQHASERAHQRDARLLALVL